MIMKFTTGLVRLSYAHIFEPKANMNGVEQYSASLIIPKKDAAQVQRINDFLQGMLKDNDVIARLGGAKAVKAGVTLPLHDADEKKPDDGAYANSFYLNAKANVDHAPKVLLYDRTECVDRSEVYSGCWVQAVLEFYPYNKNGNRGIGVSLSAVRKVKDGEPLSGATVSDKDWDDSLLGGSLEDLL